MKQLIEFSVGDGEESILVEVEEPSKGSTRAALSPGKQAYMAATTFSQALSKVIKPVAATLIQEIHELPEAPDEFEVKFGLKLSVELGAVITVKNEANLEVTLKWSRKSLHD
jgi:Trypsin-co-occurring domain 1